MILAILKGFFSGLPLFKLANISFLKLKRILPKIDISCAYQILTPDCVDPPTHLRQFDENYGEIRYLIDPITNRPSFCLVLKLSHALDVCSVTYLGFMVVNINAFCWMKHHWTWLLSGIVAWILSGMEPTIYFRI